MSIQTIFMSLKRWETIFNATRCQFDPWRKIGHKNVLNYNEVIQAIVLMSNINS